MVIGAQHARLVGCVKTIRGRGPRVERPTRCGLPRASLAPCFSATGSRSTCRASRRRLGRWRPRRHPAQSLRPTHTTLGQRCRPTNLRRLRGARSRWHQPRDIYLCKGYNGGMFWSSAICSTQRVTIDRIANLPTSLSRDQQVQVAEGRKQEALPLTLRRDLQGSVARRITRGRQTWRVQSARGAHPTTRRDRATAPVGLHTGPDQN